MRRLGHDHKQNREGSDITPIPVPLLRPESIYNFPFILKMLPVNAAVTVNYGVPGLKVAMDMVGYYGGDPRPPLLPPKPEVKEKIKAILGKAGLL